MLRFAFSTNHRIFLSKRMVAQGLARKLIRDLFAPTLPSSPDVTSQTIYASTVLHFHLTCLVLKWERESRKWRRLFYSKSTLCQYFFLPKVISNLLISLKDDWERIFEVRGNECWNVFGRVIGRSFDHIFDRISNTYVWMFTCIFENVIWTIHSVETPVWRSEEDFLTSTRSSVCLGRLLDVWWFPW